MYTQQGTQLSLLASWHSCDMSYTQHRVWNCCQRRMTRPVWAPGVKGSLGFAMMVSALTGFFMGTPPFNGAGVGNLSQQENLAS